jgi:hypothetical protein
MKCGFCNHEEKDHCGGGVRHTDYKEDARMVPAADRRRSVTCTKRHCNQILCCCVEFQLPKEKQ